MGLQFFSWVRTGLSAKIAGQSWSGGATEFPSRAGVGVSVTVDAGGTEKPERVEAFLNGPGDAIGIDSQQILRTLPEDGAKEADPNYFPMIEFDRPDLPWLLTPLKPRIEPGMQGLPPWLCLVALRNPRNYPIKPATPDKPLPSVVVSDPKILPDLKQSWMWAHAQALTGSAAGDDPGALLEGAPDLNLSRLLAPIRLQPNSEYGVYVVPVFKAGAQAGRGEDVAESGGYAWDGAGSDIDLPFYASWNFSTGETGDFQYLVTKLEVIADDNAGICGLKLGAEAAELGYKPPLGAEPSINLESAIVSPAVECGAWSGDWAEGFRKALENRLKPQPWVMPPPVYGSPYTGDAALSGTAAPKWLRELNLDPRYRVAAAMGTQVIQKYQEELMASAWRQAAQIREVNAGLINAQLAMVSSRRIYEWRIGGAGAGAAAGGAPMSDANLLAFTAPIHRQLNRAGLNDPADMTVAPMGGNDAALAAAGMDSLLRDKLTASVLSPSYRKMLRPNGKLMKKVPIELVMGTNSAGPSAARRRSASFDDFVKKQLYEAGPADSGPMEPAPSIMNAPPAGPATASLPPVPAPTATGDAPYGYDEVVIDGSPPGYLSDILLSYGGFMLKGEEMGFDGEIKRRWTNFEYSYGNSDFLRTLHEPCYRKKEKNVNFKPTLPAIVTAKDWPNKSSPASSVVSTVLDIDIEMVQYTVNDVFYTGAFSDQGQACTVVFAKMEQLEPDYVDLSFHDSCANPPKTQSARSYCPSVGGTSSIDKRAFPPATGARLAKTGPYASVSTDYGPRYPGGAASHQNYDESFYRRYELTIKFAYDGNDGRFMSTGSTFQPYPGYAPPYTFTSSYTTEMTAKVTIDRKMAFKYCLAPGFVYGSNSAKTEGAVWHTAGGAEMDYGNAWDLRVQIARRGGQRHIILTWRADSRGGVCYDQSCLYMLVGYDIDKTGAVKPGNWSKITELRPDGTTSLDSPNYTGARDESVCKTTAAGDRLYVLRGNIMHVYRLRFDPKAQNAVWDVKKAPWPLFPAWYQNGVIAALDSSSANGTDLLFVSCMKINNEPAYSCYRIAYDVDEYGRAAGWSESFNIPTNRYMLNLSYIRLFVGPTDSSAAARINEWKEGLSAGAGDLKRRVAAALAYDSCKAAKGPMTAGSGAGAVPGMAAGVAAIPGRLTPEQAAPLAEAIRRALEPRRKIRERLGKKLELPPAAKERTVETMAPLAIAPRFTLPAADLLIEMREDSFFIGASRIADNTVTLLKPNAAFIEAYMTGLNHEMGREFLWRDFPADYRATYFDTFWDKGGGGPSRPDIGPISGWDGKTGLGSHMDYGNVGLLLVIRGELIRRMPGVLLYATPATTGSDGSLVIDENKAHLRQLPMFSGRMRGGTVFFAFALTSEEALGGGGEGWFFVFQENPTAPRFGVNESNESARKTTADNISNWSDIHWDMLELDERSRYIDLDKNQKLKGKKLMDAGGKERRWAYSPAETAHIMLQPPVRVAVHASRFIEG